ncbi:sulfur oxidation c-type cytochrome SoxA [Archangium sp.]|uniref:sulfur oxidation c-type cytochrome SoxA n=1 Tax=Archangium sp. TaxID=1872627 RepID=UPI002ED9E8A7
MIHRPRAPLLAAGLVLVATASSAQDSTSSTTDEIAKYREMLEDDNPADLWVLRGAELWKTKRGPKDASLEQCNLGLGAGVVKGVYAQLPRYFADTGRVQDLESRLVTCMMTLQGLSLEEVTQRPFGNGSEEKSDMEALVSWLVSESRGLKLKVPTAHAKEKEAYEIGRQIFSYRAGPHDFACATCHSQEGRRIRLQELPNLTTAEGARKAYGAWPAYRVSQGEVRTMQHRLYDCFRQQRFPEPRYASDVITALTMYLAVSANGGELQAPTIKR